MAMRVVPVAQLDDNYAYLVIDVETSQAAVVDVAEAASVRAAAEREGVTLVSILSTHHHHDHVGGNDELIALLADPNLKVFGYAGDSKRIPGITDPLDDRDTLLVGSLKATAIFIPAHTRGHLAYWFEADGAVFTGDTLFAGGCGRLFEGDAPQMKASLERLAGLPDDTAVYCGHEYTQGNLKFAATLEPGNEALARRMVEVDALRSNGTPTVPTTIALEKATNPFLRSDSPELRASVLAQVTDLDAGADSEAVFAATRTLKDSF
jgi:hydroxyacylglutathione hydrolase